MDKASVAGSKAKRKSSESFPIKCSVKMFSHFPVFRKYLKYLNPPSNYTLEKKIVRKDKDLDQFGSVTGHRIFISHFLSQYFFRPPSPITPHKDMETPHFTGDPFLIL